VKTARAFSWWLVTIYNVFGTSFIVPCSQASTSSLTNRYKSTLSLDLDNIDFIKLISHFRVRTFFFFLIFSKLREKGWIVNLRQVIPTSPLSLWYGMFPREDFFGFILIKTWMFNIITNFGAGS